MNKENTIKLIKSFKGQLVIFLLLWSSCQTMSYYLVTENHRKANNIQKHYAEEEAIVEGLDIYHFTFPDGEKVLVTYATEETKKPALFFSYNTQDNFGAGFTPILSNICIPLITSAKANSCGVETIIDPSILTL